MQEFVNVESVSESVVCRLNVVRFKFFTTFEKNTTKNEYKILQSIFPYFILDSCYC